MRLFVFTGLLILLGSCGGGPLEGTESAAVTLELATDRPGPEAMTRTLEIVEQRLEHSGLRKGKHFNLEPLDAKVFNLTLTNVSSPDTILRWVSAQGKLEVWETFENGELFSTLEKINEYLKAYNGATFSKDTIKDQVITQAPPPNTALPKLEDLMAPDTLETNVDPWEEQDDEPALQTFEDFAAEHPLFGILTPILVADPQTYQYYPAAGPAIGYSRIEDTAQVNEYLKLRQVKRLFGEWFVPGWEAAPYDDEGLYLRMFALKKSVGTKPTITNDHIAKAKAIVNEVFGGHEVEIKFSEEGAERWALMTRKAANKTPKHSIAIVVDGMVLTAPTVQGEITGGRMTISGTFSMLDAQLMATILQTEVLPVPLKMRGN